MERREPWTYSLIEMHEAAKDELADLLRQDDSFKHYGFSVDRVCRCEFNDGETYYLIWLETASGEESEAAINVALWLEGQLEECGYASSSFSVMLNGVEIS